MSDEKRLKVYALFVAIMFFAAVLGVMFFVAITTANQGAKVTSAGLTLVCPWDKEKIEAYNKEPEPKLPLVIMNCT